MLIIIKVAVDFREYDKLARRASYLYSTDRATKHTTESRPHTGSALKAFDLRTGQGGNRG